LALRGSKVLFDDSHGHLKANHIDVDIPGIPIKKIKFV